MYVDMPFITETDQRVSVSTDSDNPEGIMVTVSELDSKGSQELRLYLSPKEIDAFYSIMKDVETYRRR